MFHCNFLIKLSEFKLRMGNIHWFVWAKNQTISDGDIVRTGPFELDSPVVFIQDNEPEGYVLKDVYGMNPVYVQEIGNWYRDSNILNLATSGWEERRKFEGVKLKVTAFKAR